VFDQKLECAESGSHSTTLVVSLHVIYYSHSHTHMSTHIQGRPHFRRFRLTPDLTRLTWESAKNFKTDATVLITQITEIKMGQNTPNFKRNPIPQYEVLHFSTL